MPSEIASSLLTPASLVDPEVQERQARLASLQPFFRPSSVAVIGASRDPASIGHRLLQAILHGGFEGVVFPVNPRAASVAGLRCYPSVGQLPEPVDLAIIAVPREAVIPVVEECAEAGIRAVIVITSGFAEAGEEGRVLQRQLSDRVRSSGLRLIGPNCLGLLTTDPAVSLHASFIPVSVPPGHVAMSSESGAIGLALLRAAGSLGLGISSCVSVGNRIDVSSNDLLEYWEEDANTDVILLYLESFGNPRRFARIARRVSRRKPIVVVKAGRTSAGRRAAGSHTAALAASDVAVEALFRQAGVIRADTLQDLFDLASALASQPLPAGNRVAIITNAGGPAILCADTCEAAGLILPSFSPTTSDRLRSFLPVSASVGNPIDLIASATPEHYRQAVADVVRSEEVDSLIVIHVAASTVAPQAVLDAVRQGLTTAVPDGRPTLPLLVCQMLDSPLPTPSGLLANVPCYGYPEEPARVLGKMAAYAEWRRQPPGIVPTFPDVQRQAAHAICDQALKERGPGWLTTDETHRLLRAFRLPLAPGGVGRTAAEAVVLAHSVGFPVAVKLASRQITHKTEMGGVWLNVADEAGVVRTFEEIRERLERAGQLEAMEGVLVQPMIAGGTEVMMGVTQDPLFGPLIAFGLGGIHVEVLGDVCFRVTPLTDRDAAEMVQGIRGTQLLQGYRGHPPADLAALENLLLRLSLLVEEVPEVGELDLNPVFALPPGQGCRIVDARVWVGHPSPGQQGPTR